jgi:hypothetical protein
MATRAFASLQARQMTFLHMMQDLPADGINECTPDGLTAFIRETEKEERSGQPARLLVLPLPASFPT